MKIKKIYKEHYIGKVYNISVKDNHNYFANNILVSNCHEKSTINGKHADLEYILDFLQELPKGTELAFGGGNPLSHPGLVPFLETCKSLGLVSNMTINYKHISSSYKLINKLINSKLIYGLGISVSDDFEEEIIDYIDNKQNVVYHVIAGVNDLSILDKIKESSVKKCLILGYKDHGRGITYRSEEVTHNLINWFECLGQYIKKVHLSFDNLALKQLNVKQYLTNKEWDSFYMGADGVFTMYIDAVKQEYAMSSVSITKFPLIDSMKDVFSNIKSQSSFSSEI